MSAPDGPDELIPGNTRRLATHELAESSWTPPSFGVAPVRDHIESVSLYLRIFTLLFQVVAERKSVFMLEEYDSQVS